MPNEHQQELRDLHDDLREDIQAKVIQEVTSRGLNTPTPEESHEPEPMPDDISPVPQASASPAIAWWFDQHGAEVPLSPGASAQLQVSGRSAWAEGLAQPKPGSPACSSPDKAPAAGPRAMSHDGLGSRPLSRQFNTPSAADPFPQEAYTSMHEQPEVPPSPHGDHLDRHHVKATAMNVAVSCWRRGEVGGQPAAPAPLSSPSQSPYSSDAEVKGQGAQVLPSHDEYYDALSPHHPDGHWDQIKREGEISSRLTASALNRTASNGSIFVQKDMVGASCGQSSFGMNIDPVVDQLASAACTVMRGSCFADSAFSVTGGSVTSHAPTLIDTERTLAEFANHGRTCHSPKYFGSKAEPDEHGALG